MEQPNLSYIQSMSRGDQAFEQKILDIIKKEFPEEKKIYFNNLKKHDYKLTAENVHKLKHKISILGLEKSYKIAENFEKKLKENNDASDKEVFNDILQNMTQFLATL